MFSLANESGWKAWRLIARQYYRSAALLVLCAQGCNVGPKYVKPSVQTPASFKEAPAAKENTGTVWRAAQPQDETQRGEWWKVYQDEQLDQLEVDLNASNQTIAAATANFVAARALVREARSQYFPSVTTNPSIMNSRPSPAQFGGLQTENAAASTVSVKSYTNYSLPFDASWELDLWGRVRNAVRANVSAAQGSAADMENIRLSAQAELAADYYALEGQDALKRTLERTTQTYRQTLELTKVRYKAGLDSEEAVFAAEAQLRSAEAQETNVGVLRSQYEHAIAVLVGQPASTFSVSAKPLEAQPPVIPAGIPSDLLERRPDIASAERVMAQANAEIGVAKAAFYPTVTLSATGGFGNSSFTDWLTWPSRFWSVGSGVAQSVFDAGLRRAVVQQYRADYDVAVANYRETVLTAFQQVEDDLAALRILSQVVEQQDSAVRAAERNLQVAQVRYKSGLDPFLNVIAAQTILLNNQQAEVNYRTQQMEASVQLIKALGGGWDRTQLPTPKEAGAK